jgi:DHA2 family methylenomycin A resistance protein-like MFS transporter
MSAASSPAGRWVGPVMARVVLATAFAFIVVQLDVTVVNVALARIGADLGASVAGLQWVVDAYTLAFAASMLSAGVLGDLLGARRAYLGGLGLFVVASLACGAAPDIGFLIAARAVQGLGAAFVIPNSLALLNHAAEGDSARRARAVGFWTGAGGVAVAIGPVAGGLLQQLFGWRSIFYLNLPLGLLGGVLTALWVPSPPPAGDGRGFDPLGQVLSLLALTGFTGALIELGPLGMAHPVVWGGLALAFVSALAFARAEDRAEAPLLPPALFRQASFTGAVAFGALVNLTFYGLIFVLSLYLQSVRGYSPLQTGLAYLPLTATVILANVTSGWLTARTGPRLPMIAGALVGALGFALLSTLDDRSAYGAMLPPFVLIPIGIGLAVPAMTASVLGGMAQSRAGTASAILNTARQAGGAVGVALFGALAHGGGSARIVSGLHWAATVSTGLLLLASGLAAWSNRGQPGHPSDAAPASHR